MDGGISGFSGKGWGFRRDGGLLIAGIDGRRLERMLITPFCADDQRRNYGVLKG